MEFFNIVCQNILSPGILFFALGIMAGFMKSDLEVPESISRYLAIYLMMSIGFKGGVAIVNTPELSMTVYLLTFIAIVFSFLHPFLGYFCLRKTTRLDSPTAAAVAAHYGSISMVTFATAVSFLSARDIHYGGYIVAILALMEAPAILSGLFIAHRYSPSTKKHKNEEKKLVREIFTNGAILLLLGSFLIGCLTGQPGMNKVAGFLDIPFQGVLCLFLLDMGLVVSQNLHQFREFSLGLLSFGFYMPLMGGGLGLLIAYLLHLDLGTGVLFTVLCASASYIAVPAAMRLALPEAKAGIYLPMSLGVTFPFNIVLGIPLYFSIGSMIL